MPGLLKKITDKRAAGEHPVKDRLRSKGFDGHRLQALRRTVATHFASRPGPGLMRRGAQRIPDQCLSPEEFDAFCRTFQSTWEGVHGTVLDTLTAAIKTPSDDPDECMAFLHELDGVARRERPLFEPKGFLQLLATLYSFEGPDIDALAGFPESKGPVNPSPYKVLLSSMQAHPALCPRCARAVEAILDLFSPMAADTTVFPCTGLLRLLLSPKTQIMKANY